MSAPVSQVAEAPISSPSSRFPWGRWLVLAIVVAGVVLFFTVGPDEQTVIERSGEWRSAAREHPTAAVALFVAVEVVVVGLSVPVGVWLTVLAGFLFGTWLGTAVSSVAATLGAVGAFLGTRCVFCDALHRAAASRPRFGQALAAIDRGFRDHGAYYILLLRMTPIFPFWLLNIGFALTRVRLWDYWWASQLGVLPVTVVVANAGASLATIASFRDVLSLHVLGALSLMPLIPFVLHHTAGRWLMRARPKGA